MREGHRWSKKEILEEIIYMDDHKIAFTKREQRTYHKDISPSKVYQAARKRFKRKDGKTPIGKHAAIKLAEAWHEREHGYSWPLIDPTPEMNTPTRIIDRIIRPCELAKAIYHATKRTTAKEDCIKTADYIFSYFGFENYMIDNPLGNAKAGLRDPFYFLESLELLKTPPLETTKLETMENWRIPRWVLRKTEIIELAYYGKKRPEAPKDPAILCYDSLPEHSWVRGDSVCL